MEYAVFKCRASIHTPLPLHTTHENRIMQVHPILPKQVLLSILLTTALTHSLRAETFSVCSGGGCDFDSIQAAIDAASDGDVIEVSGEVYLIDQTIDTNGKAVRIVGSVDPDTGQPTTIIDGQGMHQVLQCISREGPDTAFEHLVIRNGFTMGLGGGMHVNASAPSLTNCTFSDNFAGYGGGMYTQSSSSPTLTDCRFIDNSATVYSGGMYNRSSSPTLLRCTFTGNFASYGGAIRNFEGFAVFSECTFENNSSDYGGAINNNQSTPSFIDCTFTGNFAEESGGGMYNRSDSRPSLTNCTFNSNSSAGDGGGVSNDLSTPTLVDCTFTDNTAETSGGGLYNRASSPLLSNCTFSGNVGSAGGGMANTRLIPTEPSEGSTPLLIDCLFTDNTAASGGGIRNSNSQPILSGTILCGNTPNQVVGSYIEESFSCIVDFCTELDQDGDGVLECSESCTSDLDGDGDVGGTDLTQLLADWGCSDDDCVADLDESGSVDGADLTIILSAWGACSE